MADSFIQLPADSTGKKVDTRTEGTNSEHREVHVIGDPSANEGLAVVTNVDPTGETYGVVVRDPNTTTIASRVAYGATTGTGTSSGALRTILASDSIMSTQTNTDAMASNDSPAVIAYMAGLNGTTWDRAKLANLGSGETQSTTLRTIQATDAIASVQTQFIARQTNPTAATDATAVLGTSDDLGRQLVRFAARDLIATARVALANGTETTLVAAVAGSFLDLMSITASNSSTAAQAIDVRAVTGGNIVITMNIPASGQYTWTPPIPWPQDVTGNNWTVDNADVTNSTVNISALFIKEV